MKAAKETFKYFITYVSKMLLDKNTLNVLEEFASDYSRKVYGSDIAKRLKMNQKTVSNILNRLENDNIIKFSVEGKNKYYYLNKFNPDIKETIKLIEIGRKIGFLDKYKNLKDLFRKLEERTSGLILIFGSYAKEKANKESDLDVFVMGKISEVEDLENLHNLKINIIKSTKEKFNSREHIIKEIINNHIVLKGVEEFVDLAWQ